MELNAYQVANESFSSDDFNNFDLSDPSSPAFQKLKSMIDKKNKAPNLVASIQSVSQNGQVTIEMSKDIIVPKSYSQFND